VFQQHNSWGGPIKYVFGVDAQGKSRHQAAEKLVRQLPPRAKVSASGFTTPYISNRPDAYNMTLGVFDAQYIFFPSEAGDFIVDERATVTRLLKTLALSPSSPRLPWPSEAIPKISTRS
jgi:hypothetical protein